MLIRHAQNSMSISRARGATPAPSEAGGQNRDKAPLDFLSGRHDRLSIHLDEPEYQNLDSLQGAHMLGHFTQTMQNQGYPWKLSSAEMRDDGSLKKGTSVSDMEALKRLNSGEPVLFQPQRDLQLDLSGGSITALAAAGTIGGAQLNELGQVAAYSKSANVHAGKQGVSLKFGEPVVIDSLAELKLLHQMYSPTDKIEAESETAKAAQQFSYFTQKTVGSAYPWRFYVKDDQNAALRVTKNTLKGAASGAAVGGALAGAFGGLLALGFRNIDYLFGAMAIGTVVGGASGSYESVRTSLKGTPVNAVKALENVLESREVVFQESRARSVNIPVVGNLSWFSDLGKGSSITNTDELNTFYYMQSQAELPKPKASEEPAAPKKPEAKPESAPTNITIINDRSVHQYISNTAVGL